MKLIIAVLVLFVACTLALEKRQINFGETYGQTPSFVVHGYTCDKFVEHAEFSTNSDPSCFTAIAASFDLTTRCGVPYRARYKPWTLDGTAQASGFRIATACFPANNGKDARITLSVVSTDGNAPEIKEGTFFINVFAVDGNNRYKLVKFSYTPSCGDSKAGRCYDYKVEACCEETLCGPVVKRCRAVYDNNANHRNKITGGFIYNYNSAGFKGTQGFAVPDDEVACLTGNDNSRPYKKDGESRPFIDDPWNIHQYGDVVSYQSGNGKCCYGVSPSICSNYCKESPLQPVQDGVTATPSSNTNGNWYSSH